MRRPPPIWVLIILALLLCGNSGSAYRLFGARWPVGSLVTMHMKLGDLPGFYLDGTTASWNTLGDSALSEWNPYLDTIQFQASREPDVVGDFNGVNDVYFSSTAYGEVFESRILAVTLRWAFNGVNVESDVIFNNARAWNSYRGPVNPEVVDFRRVALHEFGHVLGLDHPNGFGGQDVAAIMNSPVNSVDHIVADDISGVQSLYAGGAGSTLTFPSRYEALDFRRQLESFYETQLHAARSATFVDLEGSIVWLSEYLRYRVGACSHQSATRRVFAALDNAGVYGLCAVTNQDHISFPARNETLDFQNQLEAKYRDGLRREPSPTFVDNEGSAVWVQEYLRYRLSGCAHGDATSKVFAQISGLGIQPVCR